MKKLTICLLMLVLSGSLLLASCQYTPDSLQAGKAKADEGEVHTLLKREEPGHIPTIVIDPGHGFGDVGAAGPATPLGQYEWELTIDMAKALKGYLEERDFRVYLTHDGEKYPSVAEIASLADQYGVSYDKTKEQWQDNTIFSPYERVIYMNCLDAMVGVDFAISIHVNANENSSDISGFDLDYCAENDWSDQSRVIAQVLKDKLHTAYPESNLWYYEDKWDESFIVTKFNTMPSVLLETGYYTNEEDVKNLKTQAWRDSLMQRVAEAIDSAFEQ
ncbi:MAG: N-acetylmuramoyl-L-alanine amidase [Clostridiales bacterium]|nr:N-acetylmuramoyl-L-alanine amidase [Clostridiales bacterium]